MSDSPRFPSCFESISLKNFRGFKEARDIPLAPLTFLVGPNSSGKSSISNALLLAVQSNWLPTFSSSFSTTWIGQLTDLGSYKDCVYRHNQKLKVQVSVRMGLGTRFKRWRASKILGRSIEFEFSLQADPREPSGRMTDVRVTDCTSKEVVSLKVGRGSNPSVIMKYRGYELRLKRPQESWRTIFDAASNSIRELTQNRSRTGVRSVAALKRIAQHLGSAYIYNQYADCTQRVSSGRLAPQRWYSRTGPRTVAQRWSRDTRHVYDSVDPILIDQKERRTSRRKSIAEVLRGLNIADDISRSTLSPYHENLFVRDNITKVESNLIDVGFGASQIIPVISACLDELDGLLVIEQPELHLHPKAQGGIASLLAKTSLRRQLIVETHSVHIINKIRLMIARGELDPRAVVINYVDRNRSGSHVTPILIKSDGEFDGVWPVGFFDERYEDTMTLLSLRNK